MRGGGTGPISLGERTKWGENGEGREMGSGSRVEGGLKAGCGQLFSHQRFAIWVSLELKLPAYTFKSESSGICLTRSHTHSLGTFIKKSVHHDADH